MFGTGRVPEPRSRMPLVALGIAVAASLVLLVVGFLLATRGDHGRPTNAQLPLDPYAASLVVSGIQMSESTSLSGGKSTYIDGTVRNTGTQTVTGATVQVLFGNDEQLPPQIETLPLTLIRTREPYVDTEPVSAEPLKPGDSHEFRLIFEDIGTNWNQQLPVIRIVHVKAR